MVNRNEIKWEKSASDTQCQALVSEKLEKFSSRREFSLQAWVDLGDLVCPATPQVMASSIHLWKD